MKKQISVLLSLFSATSTSFTLQSTFSARRPLSSLYSSEGEVEPEAPSDVESDESSSSSFQISDTATAGTDQMPIALRNELLTTAKSLTKESPTGIFITLPSAMEEFSNAVSRLEAITPTMTEQEKDLLVGDWVLLATSRKIAKIDLSSKKNKLPFNLKTPPKLSDSIRNSVTVLQRIRTDGNADNNDIDRIDHVIEYTPLTLSDLIPENSPLSAIRNLDLNPLEVSQSKVVLVHNAQVESVEPTLRTKLGLKSVVLNVAGKSQNLDPSGADIFGLNVPSLGEFANGGSFDTTYVDENVRISRGSIGFLEELRVFVRDGYDIDAAEGGNVTDEEVDTDFNDEQIVTEETTVSNASDTTVDEEEISAEETEIADDDSVSANDTEEEEDVETESNQNDEESVIENKDDEEPDTSEEVTKDDSYKKE